MGGIKIYTIDSKKMIKSGLPGYNKVKNRQRHISLLLKKMIKNTK